MALAVRIRALLHPASVDRELAAEIQYHLDREIEPTTIARPQSHC